MEVLFDLVDKLLETRFKIAQLSRNLEELYDLCVALRDELENEEEF